MDALVEALEPYEGTLVFISHDVHFIRAIANHVVRVEHGRLRHFPGGYEYYLDTTGQSARKGLTSGGAMKPTGETLAPSGSSENKTSVRNERKEQKRLAAEQRQARSRQRRELHERVQAVEAEIAGLEAREKELVQELEAPETYAATGRAVEINAELRAIHERLPAAHAAWEAAATELAGMDLDAP